MGDDVTETRDLHFSRGPFGFDQSGRLRCAWCSNDGIYIGSNELSGLSWQEKQAINPLHVTPNTNTEPESCRIPESWNPAGSVTLPSQQIWESLYRENWAHARHVELQRLGYATIYGGTGLVGLIVAAIGAGGEWQHAIRAAIFLSLALYTWVQMQISRKLSEEFKHHIEHVRLLHALTPGKEPAPFCGMPMGGLFTVKGRGNRFWRRNTGNAAGNWETKRLGELIPFFYKLILVIHLLIFLLFSGLQIAGLDAQFSFLDALMPRDAEP